MFLCCFCIGTLFFSVNSISLRIFSRVKLQEAFDSAKRLELTNHIIENIEKLILTCSLFRLIFYILTLHSVSLLYVNVRSKALSNLQPIDYLIIFICSIFTLLIFGFSIPNAMAKYVGEKVLSKSYRLLLFLSYPSWPVLRLYKFADILVRRLAGVAEITLQEHIEVKQEEFLNGLEQRKMEGVVDEEEQEMIENVLELSDTTADEIMTPRTDLISIEVNSDRKTVLKTITEAGHSRVPVYEEKIDNIIGLIYAKDLLSEIDNDGQEFELRKKMRPAFYVPETKPVRELLHEFQNQKLHIAVVLDEYGGTAGIVTLEDIIEELVGEITDEYEEMPAEPIKQINENTLEVDARTYIDDINDEYALALPEDEDYDTVGGFVFSHLGYIPKAGVQFDYENLHFLICAAEARKIKKIKIIKKPDSENAQ